MKPIIVDMKDMSDSTEVYDSKPNRFLVYTIYLVLLILIAAVLWMYFFKIDIVVKSNGFFRGSSSVYEINSAVNGTVKEIHVENGQYVTEGTVLYVLSREELSDNVSLYKDDLAAVKDRLEILSVYKKSLDGDKSELELLSDNPYYEEFVNRRDLLYANLKINGNDTDGQIAIYQGNIESISEMITQYNEKIKDLYAVKQCVVTRDNTIDTNKDVYYNMVSSYLASYNYTALQYDNQINEYQKSIDEYAERRDEFISAIETLQSEKTKALMNLEYQQITTIEQKISGYNDTILSLKSNLTSAELQVNVLSAADNESKEKISILTEKRNVEAEILTYEEKVKEYETYLRSYDIQNDNCIVKANASGYYYIGQALKTGSVVQAGTPIGTIYPETESQYYAEIYVENKDISKVKEGQKVKFEIAAYPSSEYGYFIGVVENIAKDISVDSNTGFAYYMVRVRCDNMKLKGKDGKEVSLINGLACQAKIVTDEKRVLSYLLEKIDLID